MSEPYYADKEHHIVLFHDDALRIVPWLKAEGYLPADKTITITDPPYNVGMDYDGAFSDDRPIDEYVNWCNEWFQMLPRPLLITPGQANLEAWLGYIEYPTALIPWFKPNQSSPSALGGFNAWEAILLYGKLPKRLGHDAFVMPIGQQPEVQSRRGKRHPCPKYLPFWLKLIGNVTAPGFVVFDPFAGSGTTLIACKRLGIPCVGIELHQPYCDLIVERLQQDVMAMPEATVDETPNYKLYQQQLVFASAQEDV